MATTIGAPARKPRAAKAKKTCHLEQKHAAQDALLDWLPIAKIGDEPSNPIRFAGETDARDYVRIHLLVGTFRCVWTGPEFTSAEKKSVAIS